MIEPQFIDVSAVAAEVGYGFSMLGTPVLLTQKLWKTCVQWDQSDTDAQEYQEQDARLWDVLFVCGTTLKLNFQSLFNPTSHKYSILVIPRDGSSTSVVRANLEASVNIELVSLVIDLINLVPDETEVL